MWRPRVDLSPILDIRAHGKARGARWRRGHFRLPFKNQDRKLQKTTCRIWCTAHGKPWSTCTWETMRCMRAGDQREHLFPEILAPRVNTLHMENHCRKYFLFYSFKFEQKENYIVTYLMFVILFLAVELHTMFWITHCKIQEYVKFDRSKTTHNWSKFMVKCLLFTFEYSASYHPIIINQCCIKDSAQYFLF